mmetsp:Transcript_51651/g.130597  ORF Transcript_51651/g.130597 Transcript_51651/m.130597 type:complete len:248 (-) Transcript_51651:52-795(-)
MGICASGCGQGILTMGGMVQAKSIKAPAVICEATCAMTDETAAAAPAAAAASEALRCACTAGNPDEVRRLAAATPSVVRGVGRRPGGGCLLPLHYASMAQQHAAASAAALLEAGADVGATTDEGKQAIHLAAENGACGVEVLDVLLHAKADVDARTTASRTPLHFAAVEGIAATAAALLHARASVNAMNSCGAIPLHWAAKTGKRDLCKVLVDARSDLSVMDNLGRTPVEMAEDNLQGHLLDVLRGG